jgi:hypothetical protein
MAERTERATSPSRTTSDVTDADPVSDVDVAGTEKVPAKEMESEDSASRPVRGRGIRPRASAPPPVEETDEDKPASVVRGRGRLARPAPTQEEASEAEEAQPRGRARLTRPAVKDVDSGPRRASRSGSRAPPSGEDEDVPVVRGRGRASAAEKSEASESEASTPVTRVRGRARMSTISEKSEASESEASAPAVRRRGMSHGQPKEEDEDKPVQRRRGQTRAKDEDDGEFDQPPRKSHSTRTTSKKSRDEDEDDDEPEEKPKTKTVFRRSMSGRGTSRKNDSDDEDEDEDDGPRTRKSSSSSSKSKSSGSGKIYTGKFKNSFRIYGNIPDSLFPLIRKTVENNSKSKKPFGKEKVKFSDGEKGYKVTKKALELLMANEKFKKYAVHVEETKGRIIIDDIPFVNKGGYFEVDFVGQGKGKKVTTKRFTVIAVNGEEGKPSTKVTVREEGNVRGDKHFLYLGAFDVQEGNGIAHYNFYPPISMDAKLPIYHPPNEKKSGSKSKSRDEDEDDDYEEDQYSEDEEEYDDEDDDD